MKQRKFDRRKEWGPRVNHKIRIPQIRVVTDDGKMLGIMSPQEAMIIAKGEGLDLVEISPHAKPPVCKIIEYGKYKYEQSKKSSTPKKTKFKEIKFRPRIDENDYQVKLRKILQFLGEGNQVRIAVEFRGREMQYKELGRELLQRVISDASSVGKCNIPISSAGRRMSTNLSPSSGS
jgi:translation initiation factor IF-3